MRFPRLVCLLALTACSAGVTKSDQVTVRAERRQPTVISTTKTQPTAPWDWFDAVNVAYTAWLEGVEAATVVDVVDVPAAAAPAVVASTGSNCGGTEYPPCEVAWRESRNTYDAYNPTGCGGNGCYGRWQFSGAWAGQLGLPADLSTATPEQQDAAARELWAGGAGCSHWAEC